MDANNTTTANSNNNKNVSVLVAQSSSLSSSSPSSTSSATSSPSITQTTNQNHVSIASHSTTSSALISIKIRVVDANSAKTLQFNPATLVYDALKIIKEKIPELNALNESNYGIFLPNTDPSKGVWLENSRSLEYYLLKNGDTIEYRNKFRKLHIKLLDGQSKTLQVDDSQNVAQLMIFICSQLGIANHEEYSLIHDLSESEKEKTLTLKRQHDRTLTRDYKKMEELKKKLHTDDDIAWLDHAKTLRQQGIDEASKLILKRKFFFSDKNIDTRDPIQLNLLYVQCRDAIINGSHPISEEEAIKFAAIQCQVKFGDYNEAVHRSGCLNLKEYLPKEYTKVKGIEKKIFQEYKTNLAGFKELDAKLKYIQLCRSLKTYGVTFFLVKEKMKGKNKLVARLLGITKESIVRVDEKTKEFLNVYPLECVKKWAASPNTFTLDFGDHYKEPYYSVQTTEGEHIARLISGYIDIILKKKKAKEFNSSETGEESTILEEVISPSKATLVQMSRANANQTETDSIVLPGILRNAQQGNTVSTQSLSSQMPNVNRQAVVGYPSESLNPNQSEFQQGKSIHPLVTTIQNARSVISTTHSNLRQPNVLQEIGNDPASLQWKANMIDVSRQNATSHLSAMNAATAQVVTLTANAQRTDYNAVGAAISCISTNMRDLSKDILTIAALSSCADSQSDNERLLDAARKLCQTFADFLKYVEPECSEPRQNLFGSVGRIAEAGSEIIRQLNDDESVTPGYNELRLQEAFITLAKQVASSTASLVIASKNVANHCDTQQGINEVISLVTQCALSTSQLVSCTKVCSCTISNRECQEQIVEAARQVSRHVDAVMESASVHCKNDQVLNELRQCARSVNDAVVQLLENVKTLNEQIINQKDASLLNNQDQSIERIFQATDELFNSMGDASEMIKQARILAQATTDLINSLKQEAHEQTTNDQQKKLLLAAKLLAEATSKIVEAAKGCATNPQDQTMQNNLKKAAEDLKNATAVAAGDSLQIKLIKRLELCAKEAASCATQSIAAIQVCTVFSPEQPLQNNHNQLINQCKLVADHVPKIVQGIRGCMVAPTSKSAYLGLINSCESFVIPTQKMILLSKAVIPTIIDEIKAIQLRNCTNQLSTSIAELKSCLAKTQDVCGSFESDAMIESIRMLDQDLVDIKKAVQVNTLKPLPGENLDICEAQLAAVSKTVGLSMAQMLTAAAQGNEVYTGIASKDTFNSLRSFTNSIRAIVACSANNPTYQDKLIESARFVLQQSITLVYESKSALDEPNESSQQRLAQIARQIAQSLYECVNCLPGQKDIDDVIKSIGEFASSLLTNQIKYPQTNKNVEQVHEELNQSALNLNQSTNQIVIDSRKGSQHLSQSSYRFSGAFGSFLQNSLIIAGLTECDEDRNKICLLLKELYANANKLLQSAKSCIADPSSRAQLLTIAKQLTESINSIVNECLETNNPTVLAQKECDNALRDIETTRIIINSNDDQQQQQLITEPPTNTTRLNSYYDCLDQIIEQSRLLGESMTGIANSCKSLNQAQFCQSIKDTSTSICGLVETAAHSAFIIGVADVDSKRGRAAILDTSNFINCSQSIQDICAELQTSHITKNNLIQAATQIAHKTATLCSASQMASSKTTNILAKRHFVQSAKQVANATANFVKSIKSLDDPAELKHEHYIALVKPLLESVEGLCQYALSPEFACVPAVISANGAKAQEPIVSAAQTMIDAALELVQASRLLISNNKDPQMWQAFSTNSKIISDSIKRLATSIKEKAPAKQECEQALKIIEKCMKHLESAILSVNMGQKLPLSDLANSKSLQAYQEHAISCANQIMELVDQLRVAGKGEADRLGYLVTETSQYFEPLVVNVIGCAAKTPFNNQQQSAFLEQTKTVLESAYQLLIASKECAGNPKNMSNLHQTIDENADGTKEVLDDLMQTLNEATAQNGYTANMIDNLAKALDKVDLNAELNELLSDEMVDDDLDENQKQILFIEYHTKIAQLTKTMQQNIKDLSLCQMNELGQKAQQLTNSFNYLIMACKGAINTCINRELSNRIKISSHDLGKVCIQLVHLSGQLQHNPNDKLLHKQFHEQIEVVNRGVNSLLCSFQVNAKGTQACINANSIVNGLIADLNTVIMFATAGSLKSELENDSFGNHRETILRSAKTLVEDTKSLVSMIKQDDLASGVQESMKTITKLTDAVKLGAASLGCEQPDAQVLLINAVKDVAAALSDLISTIKLASNNESSTGLLSESAKNMITNIQSLLKTVKTVEDEAARGTRALESSIEAMYQEIKAYSANVNENKISEFDEPVKVKPEDLIKATKQITLATSKSIGASNSLRQEDIIAAANMGRKAVSDLLYICRMAAKMAQNIDESELDEQKESLVSAGLHCAIFYKELMECIQAIFNRTATQETKQNLATYSKNVANSVANIIKIAELLKGNDWVDPEDPTFIAENELLGAASAIESAAKKLAILKPRSKTEAVNENLNFDEQILEAAKSVTNGAAALIKAATNAQKELVSQGKNNSENETNFQSIQTTDSSQMLAFESNSNEENGQWSHGLISAARMVAAACHTLCEAANGLVQGHATEERLISSAKQVASSTAALLVACKVKSDITSQSMKRLQFAGNAVKRATDSLVRAAQQAVDNTEEDKYLELNTNFVGSIAQEIMLREEILRKERELKAAQAAYKAVKKARYQREEGSPASSSSSGSNGQSNLSNNGSSPSSSSVANRAKIINELSEESK